MAAADYRLCDVCGCKAFYDANLQYDEPTVQPDGEWTWLPEHNTGAWAVLCKTCSETHEIKVVARKPPEGE